MILVVVFIIITIAGIVSIRIGVKLELICLRNWFFYLRLYIRKRCLIFPREIVQTQVPCGFEPNGSFFIFWVQTQRLLFRSSGFEPRG